MKEARDRPGEFITFYSYKGGSGRSMALANVACLLAEVQAKTAKGRVLMIDWDLEAPGLHRFFVPYIGASEAEIDDQAGLIDVFVELGLHAPDQPSGHDAPPEEGWMADFHLEKFVIETQIPHLDLMKAGRFDATYARRITTFDWAAMHQKTPWLLTWFANRLADRYRYVLIDSRTGETDASAICTAILPEKLVAVFTPNSQAIGGTIRQVEKAVRFRRGSADERPIQVYPLPSRIENARPALRDQWRFDPVTGYQPRFEEMFRKSFDLEFCDLTSYFAEIQVPQAPDYAYGEPIAVKTELSRDRFSLSGSYVSLQALLVQDDDIWDTVAKAPPAAQAFRAFTSKLPTADPHLFGRDVQLSWLEQGWSNPQTNFVQIIAPGGTGKTALMSRWYRRHLADATVFGWSFYGQGATEQSQTSSDSFFAEALPWFGIAVPATESIFTKVDLLVAHLRQERILLILDGIEPLQDPSGSLRDLALKALLQELAARSAGMVVATTRVRLTDVPDDPPHTLSLDLEDLAPAAGAQYLAHLGVNGPEDELRAASEGYQNHALSLTMLGTYLVTFCESDVRRRADIRELQVDETKPGRHARKLMASYAGMYQGEPELDILRALGYFDRPAEPAALKLVLPAIEDRKYQAALKRLHDARLILATDPTQPIECHPLVREYFAAYATREGHARLYEHYTKQALYQPDTLEEMNPLIYAVYHGCQAGKHVECRRDIYLDRILRGDEFYLTQKLGAFGTDLSVLANFFETPWTRPAADISPDDRSWLISLAGFDLRAVGRLADAVQLMQAAAEAALQLENWKSAAIRYGNLSELHLTVGNIAEATAAARQSVDFADRSGEWSQRTTKRTTLADVLHQSGDIAEAQQLFAEAERLQAENQPEYPILYSLPGYRYCDLLLGQGQNAQVLLRAPQTLRWAEEQGWLLSIGLGHLSLGRAHPRHSAEAAHHLEQAIEFLRRAGQVDDLPRGLLARATSLDLDEVLRIATRSGMRLYLADYHLASARLTLNSGDLAQSSNHYSQAKALLDETGYHRRDPDLASLFRAALSG
jgi:tetratricopeptide (TPR) repeat protein